MEGPKNKEGQNKSETPPRTGGKSSRKEVIEREMARRAAESRERGQIPPEVSKREKAVQRALVEEDMRVLIKDVLDASSADEAMEILKIYASDTELRITPEALQRVALERVHAVGTEEERAATRKIFEDAGILSREAAAEEARESAETAEEVKTEPRETTEAVTPASLSQDEISEEATAYYKKIVEETARWLSRGLYPAPEESTEVQNREEIKEEEPVSPVWKVDLATRISEVLSGEASAEMRSARMAVFNIAYSLYGETFNTLQEILNAEDSAQALVAAFLEDKLDQDDPEIIRLLSLTDPKEELSGYSQRIYEKWKTIVEVGIESQDPRADIVEMMKEREISQIDGEYILNEITAEAVKDAIRGVEQGDMKGPLTQFWEEKMRERQAVRERIAEQAEQAMRYYKGEGKRGRKKSKRQPGDAEELKEAKSSKRFLQQRIARSLKEFTEEEEEERAVVAKAFLEELRRDPEKMRELEESQPRGRVEEIKYQIRLFEAKEQYEREREERKNEIREKMDRKREEILDLWIGEGLREELRQITELPMENFSIPTEARAKLRKLSLLQQEFQNLLRSMSQSEVLPEMPKRTVARVAVRPSRFGISKPEAFEIEEESGLSGKVEEEIIKLKNEIWDDLGHADASQVNVESIKNIFDELDRLIGRVRKNPLPEFLLKGDLKIIRRRAKVAMGFVSEEELKKKQEQLGRRGIFVSRADIEEKKPAPEAGESGDGKKKKKGKKAKGQEDSEKRKKKS